MYLVIYATTFGILQFISATIERRAIHDPAATYLNEMCLPLLSNPTRLNDLHLSVDARITSLVNSPFPCEQAVYLQAICGANGTQEVDFLAEQECLCNGAFFEVSDGCNDCCLIHGYQKFTKEKAQSSLSSLSRAECAPSPPYQPYSNLFPSINVSTVFDLPSITLVNDKLPDDTAVSNYFTPTESPTPGAN